VKAIMDANRIANAKALRVGSTLVIPKDTAVVTVPPTTTTVVAPTSTTTVAPTPAGAIIHVVREGDTLQRISQKYYGTTKRYLEIMQANNIDDPRTVVIGTKLTIPPAPDASSAVVAPETETVAVSTPAAAAGERRYTVVEGDTCPIIAASQLGSVVYAEDIMKRNHLTAADTLRPGTVIILPARTTSTLMATTPD
jgi:nucleoid-associated protein YgaU